MKGDSTEAALPCNFNALKKVLKDRLSAKICYIFPACSIVYNYSTRPISKHLYSGIFKDPLDTKHKIFKKRLNS